MTKAEKSLLSNRYLTIKVYATVPYLIVFCRYGLKNGARIIGGREVELRAELNEIPVHVRGGNILPMQGHGITTNAACALRSVKLIFSIICILLHLHFLT